MGTRIDWEDLRHKYVTGDDSVTYQYLCTLPNSPVLATLKTRASTESWTKQRENFRIQKATKVVSDPAAIQAADQVNQLVNVAAMVTQHDAIGRALEGVAVKWLEHLRKHPKRIETLPARDVATLLRIGLDTRRLAAGMATSRQEIDVSGMSDAELEKIVNGD